MSGVQVIRQLLLADGDVTALVSPTDKPSRISPERLSQGVKIPALEITEVSSVDLNIDSPGSVRFVTDRVQVTGHANSYAELVALMAAVKKACADQRPTVSGLTNVTVHTDGSGQTGVSPITSKRAKTQDFRVKFNEQRN